MSEKPLANNTIKRYATIAYLLVVCASSGHSYSKNAYADPCDRFFYAAVAAVFCPVYLFAQMWDHVRN